MVESGVDVAVEKVEAMAVATAAGWVEEVKVEAPEEVMGVEVMEADLVEVMAAPGYVEVEVDGGGEGGGVGGGGWWRW